MKRLLKGINRLFITLINRGKELEKKKAGKKWDSIVEELRNSK